MFEDDSLHSRSCGSKSYPCLIDLNQTSAQSQRKPALSRTPDTNPVTEPARQKRSFSLVIRPLEVCHILLCGKGPERAHTRSFEFVRTMLASLYE